MKKLIIKRNAFHYKSNKLYLSEVEYNSEITVVGAGPAGTATALFLAKKGIRSLLVDRAKFPRDKICGDGLSGWVVTVLNRLDPAILKRFSEQSFQVPSEGVRFVSPGLQEVSIPFRPKKNQPGSAAGYVCQRFDFDNFLLQEAKKNPLITVVEEVPVDQAEVTNDGIILSDKPGSKKIFSKLAIFANGAQSSVAKSLSGHRVEQEHFMAGVRAYFHGVEGMHPGNYIELHFLQDFIPGYFWIFPLPGGLANVGAGIRSDAASRNKINLREKLLEVIRTNPGLKQRFIHAKMQGEVDGYGLPLGSKQRSISGERYMLAGDAASLIDPFTGEGIGNAMLSGMFAADQAERCIHANDFSEKYMREYDRLLYDKIGKELRISTVMQKLLKFPWLFNFVIGKASRNETLRETISCMLTDLDVRERLKSPSFYFKLLFG